jgi:hypothetical protein
MPPAAYGIKLKSTGKAAPVLLREAEEEGYRRAKTGDSADIGEDRSDEWRDAYMKGFTRGRLESQNMKANTVEVDRARRAGTADATEKKPMDRRFVQDPDHEVGDAYMTAYAKRREDVGGRRKTRKHKKRSRKTRKRIMLYNSF